MLHAGQNSKLELNVNFFEIEFFNRFEKPRTMDSNKSKKVDHKPLAEINDLVNEDVDLKHEERDCNDAESINENYNSGFLRRPQKFT